MNIWIKNYCIISHFFKDIMCVYMIYTHTIYIHIQYIHIISQMIVQNIDLYVAMPFTKVYSGKISGILRYGDWMTAWLCEFLSKNIVGACWSRVGACWKM